MESSVKPPHKIKKKKKKTRQLIPGGVSDR